MYPPIIYVHHENTPLSTTVRKSFTNPTRPSVPQKSSNRKRVRCRTYTYKYTRLLLSISISSVYNTLFILLFDRFFCSVQYPIYTTIIRRSLYVCDIRIGYTNLMICNDALRQPTLYQYYNVYAWCVHCGQVAG